MSRTRLNKNNAQRWQKYVAEKFAKYLNLKCGAVNDEAHSCDVQAKEMGMGGEDIRMNSPAALEVGISFEVKHGKRYKGLYNVYEQAKQNADNREPVCAIHQTGTSTVLAVVDLEFLLTLLKERGNNLG